MTTPTYTPRAGSLASQVIGFFRHNPDEELLLDDITDKFDCTKGNIHTLLAEAVRSELLARYRNDDGDYVYKPGAACGAYATPDVTIAATVAKAKAADAQMAAIDFDALQVDANGGAGLRLVTLRTAAVGWGARFGRGRGRGRLGRDRFGRERGLGGRGGREGAVQRGDFGSLFVEGYFPRPVDPHKGQQLEVFNDRLVVGVFGAHEDMHVVRIFLTNAEQAHRQGIADLLDDFRGDLPALLDAFVIGGVEGQGRHVLHFGEGLLAHPAGHFLLVVHGGRGLQAAEEVGVQLFQGTRLHQRG